MGLERLLCRMQPVAPLDCRISVQKYSYFSTFTNKCSKTWRGTFEATHSALIDYGSCVASF